MRSRIGLWIILAALYVFLLPTQTLCMPLIDRWQALMDDGPAQQAKGNYPNAFRAFNLAVGLAEREKLPPKCLPLALCRLGQVEVLSGHFDAADAHCEQLMSTVRTQRQNGVLNAEVIIWMADLADTYQGVLNPKARERCLRHACLLKSFTFGNAHRECTDCLRILASFYVDHGQVPKAIQILSTAIKIQEKNSRSNSDTLGNILYQLALDCEKNHKYNQANQLGIATINLAKASTSSLNSGLPALYSMLGMNALAQGKTSEGKGYFAQAIKECKKVSTPERRQAARLYLDALIGFTNSEISSKHYSLAETTLKHLLAVQQVIFNDPDSQYGVYNLLSIVLNEESRFSEAEQWLQKAISVAQTPNSYNQKDLPELYLRLAIFQRPRSRTTDTASESFARALDLESDKAGFHAILVLFWWGKHLREECTDVKAAFEKWNFALNLARALPPEKRGTLVADTLAIMANSLRRSGKESDAQKLEQDAHSEIQIQQKLRSKLGPDHFQMLRSCAATGRY